MFRLRPEKTFNDSLAERRWGVSLDWVRPGKMKSKQRQLLLLKRGRIACHCIGGIAMNDPDLKKLVRKGLMGFIRVPYAKGWGGDYDLKRTVAIRTPKGEEFLARAEQGGRG